MITKYSQGFASEDPDTCSLFAITGDGCSESGLMSGYTNYAKLAEKSVADVLVSVSVAIVRGFPFGSCLSNHHGI